MLIRDGFVTNSSSTNFLIISREELTANYLYNKLGFRDESPIRSSAMQFCHEIIEGTKSGVRWFDIAEINYDTVKEAFGDVSADKYNELNAKGYHTYVGHTGTDSDCLTILFTMDSVVIDEKDFYLDGKNCVW